jgi:chromosome segregation ATPase
MWYERCTTMWAPSRDGVNRTAGQVLEEGRRVREALRRNGWEFPEIVPDPFEELTQAKARLEADLAKERSQNRELATWRQSTTRQEGVRLRTENEQMRGERARVAEIVAEARDRAMGAESKVKWLEQNLSDAQDRAIAAEAAAQSLKRALGDAQYSNQSLANELAASQQRLEEETRKLRQEEDKHGQSVQRL